MLNLYLTKKARGMYELKKESRPNRFVIDYLSLKNKEILPQQNKSNNHSLKENLAESSFQIFFIK